MVYPLARAFGSKFLFAMLLKLVQDSLKFVSPQILKQLVKFVQVIIHFMQYRVTQLVWDLGWF